MKYDLIIIGGGTASAAAAIKASKLNKKILVVNSGLPLGGTCVNVGCIPTKSLLTIAGEFFYARHPGFDTVSKSPERLLNFRAAIQEKDKIIAEAGERFSRRLRNLKGVTILPGRAQFTGQNQVEVEGKNYEADKIIIAVGASTKPLPIPGLDDVRWLNNANALQLQNLPASMVIIGGGPLGIEYAQMYARFGTKITVLEAMPHILPRFDPEIAAELRRSLEEEGIGIYTGVRINRVIEQNKKKKITLQDGSNSREMECDEILLAAGIKPNTDNLGLEKAGVKTDKNGFISVDQFYQTDNPAVFAAGDCAGKMPLEAVASREGSLAIENAFTIPVRMVNYDHIPSAVFTTPQAASVGLTEQEEIRRFGSGSCTTVYMDEIPRARTARQARGVYKMVIHPRNRKVLGMHIVAPGAAEIIHEATLAVRFGLTIDDIIETVHVFPTFSEGIKRAAQAWNK